MCYGFVPVENPTSFVLKSPQKILHKIRPDEWLKLNFANRVVHQTCSYNTWYGFCGLFKLKT